MHKDADKNFDWEDQESGLEEHGNLPLFEGPKHVPITALDQANEDIASQFLFDTLIHAPKLWEVFNIRFMTVDTWRSPVKAYQIKALRTLKKKLPPLFVDKVAIKIAQAHDSIFGPAQSKIVTPVPCGNSNRADCLSVKLAEAVAKHLDLPYAMALSAPLTSKSSHPKVSRHWSAPKVSPNIRGRFLLVDDVCTTGRHMALSLKALRNSGCEASGISWIGQR